jgi:hypothetical protein
MTPQKTDCIAEQFKFEQVKSSPIIVNFQGGAVISDAGLTLMTLLAKYFLTLGILRKTYEDGICWVSLRSTQPTK